MQHTNGASTQKGHRLHVFWETAQNNFRSPKILIGLCLAAGPILYFARNLMQVLVVLLVMAIFLPSWPALRERLTRSIAKNWIIFIFVAIGFLSVFWSVDTGRSLERALRMAWEFSIGLALIVGFMSLDGARRGRAIEFCAAGLSYTAIFATFYMAVSRVTLDGPTSSYDLNEMASDFSRGAAIHAILAIPLGIALWAQNKRIASVLVVVSAITAAGAMLKLSPELALAVSFLSFSAVILLPISRYLFFTLLLGLLIGAPLLLPLPSQNKIICTVAGEKLSAAHRIVIWNFADQKISERPFLGWGLNTSRLTPGHDERVNLSDMCVDQKISINGKVPPLRSMPSHPHNVPLQIWLELGSLGVAAAALLMGFTIRRVTRAFPARQQLAVFTATICAAFMILFVSFSLFQGWLMASLFFAAAMASLCLKSLKPQ